MPMLTPATKNTLAKIHQYAELEENWDGEGASTISPHAIHYADKLIRAVWHRYNKEGDGDWIEPQVGPDTNGSIDVWWKSPERHVLICCNTDDFKYTVITGVIKQEPRCEELFLNTTIDRVMWVLCD